MISIRPDSSDGEEFVVVPVSPRGEAPSVATGIAAGRSARHADQGVMDFGAVDDGDGVGHSHYESFSDLADHRPKGSGAVSGDRDQILNVGPLGTDGNPREVSFFPHRISGVLRRDEVGNGRPGIDHPGKSARLINGRMFGPSQTDLKYPENGRRGRRANRRGGFDAHVGAFAEDGGPRQYRLADFAGVGEVIDDRSANVIPFIAVDIGHRKEIARVGQGRQTSNAFQSGRRVLRPSKMRSSDFLEGAPVGT